MALEAQTMRGVSAKSWDASDVSVPHYEDKHSGRPYVTPHQLLSYRASQGRLIETPPPAVVFGWQSVLLERVHSDRSFREITGPAGAVLELSPALGFALLPVGAPAAAIVIEELAVLGVKTIVESAQQGALTKPRSRSSRGVFGRAEGRGHFTSLLAPRSVGPSRLRAVGLPSLHASRRGGGSGLDYRRAIPRDC